jgi:hypothetical protein
MPQNPELRTAEDKKRNIMDSLLQIEKKITEGKGGVKTSADRWNLLRERVKRKEVNFPDSSSSEEPGISHPFAKQPRLKPGEGISSADDTLSPEEGPELHRESPPWGKGLKAALGAPSRRLVFQPEPGGENPQLGKQVEQRPNIRQRPFSSPSNDPRIRQQGDETPVGDRGVLQDLSSSSSDGDKSTIKARSKKTAWTWCKKTSSFIIIFR